MDRLLKAARASGSLNLSNRSLRRVLSPERRFHFHSRRYRISRVSWTDWLIEWLCFSERFRARFIGAWTPLAAMRSGGKWVLKKSLLLFCQFFFFFGFVNECELWKFRWTNCLFDVQAVELQKLILAHNSIEVLKEDLKNLPQLVVLNVSHNKLRELPAAIGEWVIFMIVPLLICLLYLSCIGSDFSLNLVYRLPLLKSLDVSFNSIQLLPEEIGSAISLVKYVFIFLWFLCCFTFFLALYCLMI